MRQSLDCGCEDIFVYHALALSQLQTILSPNVQWFSIEVTV